MRIYKPSEFAKKIGVSTKTLQRWDKCGKFKAYRTPTDRRYYTQDHYDAYISEAHLSNVASSTDFKSSAKFLLEKADVKFVLIQMDIDGFKTLNHIHGEKICDAILAQIETHLSDFVNGKGLLYRTADIFTILYPMTTIENLLNEIRYIKPKISKFNNIEYRTSWGVYIIEDDIDEIWIMFDKVSIARQSIKNTAFNDINVYNALQQNTLDEVNMIKNKMKRALDNNEFKLYLQPKYSISTKQIIGAEGLIRWIEPDGTVILPNTFIPIFEKNGFVIYTDHFIWEETCKTLHRWKERGIRLIPISINASRRNLLDHAFVSFLIDLTEKYGIEKKYLEIEITESMDIAVDNEVLTELKRNGFTILMDDFGAKYSSLNALCDSDFDVIKLDKNLIANISKNNKSRTIAKRIISMLKDIDLEITAEGVETYTQAKFLKENGCDNAQGFLYSKPVTVPDFEMMLSTKEEGGVQQ